MITKCPTENDEALKLKRWTDNHFIAKDYLVPIPNGGSRNKLEAANMKRRGQARAGVSDYFLAYPMVTCTSSSDTQSLIDDNVTLKIVNFISGLWIELKRQDKRISRPTPEQVIWLERMRNKNYAAVVAYGADDAIKAIKDYLKES